MNKKVNSKELFKKLKQFCIDNKILVVEKMEITLEPKVIEPYIFTFYNSDNTYYANVQQKTTKIL
jgi:hypothetical protein